MAALALGKGDAMKLIFGLALVCLSIGCASGHCRKPQVPQTGLPSAAAGSLGNEPQKEPTPPGTTTDKRVLVYKYDGSLQCKMGKPVSLNEMKNELRGIPIYSMEKKQDGQMHIQVCGSITGQANVFEISGADLKEAEKRGFRTWSFK